MNQRQIIFGLFCLVTVACSSVSEEKKGPPPSHINIVLVGATGDLAGKYLWKGLFSLFKEHYQKSNVRFSIYGCGRNTPNDGRQILSKMLLQAVPCHDDQCRKVKTEFVQAVQYHQLKTEEDYKTVGSKIADNTLNRYGLMTNQTSYEQGRLFYIAIPPGALSKVVQLLHTHLMPQAGHPWVRLVIEKPFGRDKKSAMKLAAKLNQHFKEEQIYRVDHYLGKPVVRLILPFRYINRATYEPLWNRQHVERVEVVMKEAIDCTGRHSFYDDVGVIRDVVQNHLMELMMLVAMDLPSNSGNITEILQKKIQLLHQVEPLGRRSTLIGQYAAYTDMLQQEVEDLDRSSNTPTFSATVLHINSARWKNIPFVLMSGKKLDEKSSYVRVVFKEDQFCMEKANQGCSKQRQVVFHITSNDLYQPSLILTSPGLPLVKDSQLWQQEDIKLNISVFGEKMAEMLKLLPLSEEEAYDSIISSAFNGQRHLFTNMNTLMASWDIWTPILEHLQNQQPRIYQGREVDPTWLNFKVKDRHLEYMNADPDVAHIDVVTPVVPRMTQIPSSFLGKPLITGKLQEIIAQLAKDIYHTAEAAIAEKGVFHIAFSGGSGPPFLFKHLVESYQTVFPWQHTHLWQVDERCVPWDDSHSNFGAMQRHLLQFVHMPYTQIHAMQVLLHQEPCQPDDNADSIYESTFRRVLPDGALDFILLGIGHDGHTASLFPGHTSINVKEKFVVYTDGGPLKTATRRLTLTFEAINRAKHIGVLVAGDSKHDILTKVSAGENSSQQYPILGVTPGNNTMVFYIDHEALLGKSP